ncbi:MAG TPA: MbnP family copper-binding protein [Myxococcaceae bacterium]
MKTPIRLTLAVLLATACGDEPTDPTDENTELSIVFKPMVGSQDFACGQTYTGLGTTATTYEPKDFRLYIHNVRLVSHGTEVPLTLTDDGAWQRDGVALLDFENKTGLCSNGTEATNNRLVGTAPENHYTGLRFTVGVPFEKNHLDASTAASPLNVSTLFWSWEGGYKFLRLDGRTRGLPSGHNLHLGSTGCQTSGPNQVTSCQNSNRFEVEITDFDFTASSVVLDVATLFGNSNLDANQAQSAPGCMSTSDDADCAPVFQRLGLAFGGTQANPSGQLFFRKE